MKTPDTLFEKLYPLQNAYLQKLVVSGKINHAYTMVGVPEGAQESCIAQWCRALVGDTYPLEHHPDVLMIDRVDEGAMHGIEEAKRIRQHLLRKPLISAHRIAVLSGAESLTTAAVNALLKIVEEPPPSAVLFFSVSRPLQLPATMRSRMQFVHLPALGDATVRDVLVEEGIDVRDIPAAVALIHGAFERLIQLMQGDEKHQLRVDDQQFWLTFLAGDLASREQSVQRFTARGSESTAEAYALPRLLNALEALLHTELLSKCGAGISGVHAGAHRVLEPYSRRELYERLLQVEQLRIMTSEHVNKKIIFEYLTFAL